MSDAALGGSARRAAVPRGHIRADFGIGTGRVNIRCFNYFMRIKSWYTTKIVILLSAITDKPQNEHKIFNVSLEAYTHSCRSAVHAGLTALLDRTSAQDVPTVVARQLAHNRNQMWVGIR